VKHTGGGSDLSMPGLLEYTRVKHVLSSLFPRCDKIPHVPTPTLRPPNNLVAKRAIGYWMLRDVPGWLILTAVQVVLLVSRSSPPTWQWALLIATVAVAVTHIAVMPQWRYRVHRWEATGEAVYTQTGWFSQERRIAPISRIQTVDMHRGPFEQLFNLANVTVTTASAAGPLRIHGLDREVAQRLVDDLTSITASAEGDAT
jgi:membrane protein YdbS with pleckstrin-like domain